ncbi:hypothetical protein [Symmachiella dynata]|uniref:hypothetical protein n=1 Tax=Symmachiella dynata TaxID=2527995 RepID=UPI0030ED4B7E
MKLAWLISISLVLTTVAAAEDRVGDRRLEFLSALRERAYFDYALLYLEQLEARQDLSDELRQELPLEKALILLEDVRQSTAAAEQHAQLDLASAELSRFLQANPDHERAAQANSELGQVFVQKGRVDVFQSRSPSNLRRKSELRKSAREYFQKAREVFTKAEAQHKAAFEKFDTHIDQKKYPKEYAARRAAEKNYLQAQFNLAHVTFYESETFDAGSDENKKLLEKAAAQFEKIHNAYRSLIVGLYSRMWQGKCHEELGNTSQALGIYNELLGHAGTNETLARLQDAVQRFRMACLNSRGDHVLVIDEANEWLNQRERVRYGSRDHLGILWERILAREALAAVEGTDEKEKGKLLRPTRSDLTFIKSRSAELREMASEKERVIQGLLKIANTDPEEFDVALMEGRSLVTRIGTLNQKFREIQNSNNETAIEATKQERTETVAEAVRILNLAIQLSDQTTKLEDLNRVRYWLAVAYFFMDDHEYDAAVIGDFIARRYKDATPSVALDAAFLSMTAHIEAFNANRSPTASAEIDAMDLQPVISMAELITTHWPKQPKADDARVRLGEFYNRLKQYQKAADHYNQVDESADQYLDAQLKAGQAYWNAYVAAASNNENEPVDDKTTQQWLEKARQHLVVGIAKMQEELAPDVKPSDSLTYAKLTLSMIHNETGDFPAAVELLAGKQFAVLPQVATTAPRPEQGVTSVKFATAAYQQAMRAYVGTRDINKAQAVLQELENLGSSDVVTGQLVQLGKQLQEEVERLRSRNDPRLPDVVKSFEEFLTAMYERENQTLQMLSWVGLTYYDLGQGLSNGKVPPPPEAVDKFARSAAVFTDALKRYEADPTLGERKQADNWQLRLARALHQQGEYEQAQKLIMQILSKNARAIDVQMEAAMLMTDWAIVDPSHAAEHLEAAIGGVKPSGGGDKIIWGWGTLSQKVLTAMLQGGDAQKIQEWAQLFAESRYWLAVCRRRLGLAQSATDEQVRYLELALLDITSTVHAGANISQTPWWTKLNALNKDIHSDLGRTAPADLRPPVSIATTEPTTDTTSEQDVAIASPTDSPAVAATVPETSTGSGNLTLLIAGGLTLAFVAVMGYLLFAGGKKKPRRYR